MPHLSATEAAAAMPDPGWFLTHAWLIPIIPALAFAVIILFGKKVRFTKDPMADTTLGAYIGIASLFSSFVLSAGAAVQWIQRVRDVDGGASGGALRSIVGAVGRSVLIHAGSTGEGGKAYVAPVIKTFTWWQSGSTKFTIGTHVDGLSITLIVVVSLISTLVQLYSLEYVRGDRRFNHFFAALSLFSAGMLCMVLAENTVELLLGWEIMGLCSFMLIGHWWEDGANSRAALKAFFTVRVGDTGLLIGISILFFSAGTFSIDGINRWALQSGTSHQVLFWASIAMFIAVIGKSGQFPLHTWLPDAMAGPTPVSSLLHSSTMVVAGVYLVARLYSVFYVGFHIADGGVNPMALIGGITILISGLLALVQVDIKKVLAYSTVGQLGYMIMGLGVGAWTPAVFHIFTHAWFKACLFLGAGSVSHSASHHSFDMKKDMGGLRKKMPITFATFMISTIALCGIPPLAGFFSKDEIIDNAGHHGYVTFMVIGLIGAFMTAAYMARTVYLTFFGEARGASAGVHHDEHAEHAAPAMAHAGAASHGDSHVATVPADTVHGGDAHGAHDAEAHGDAHGGPHESNWLITTPLVILAALAVTAGWLGINTPALKVEKFAQWMAPRSVGGSFPFIAYGEAKWAKLALSVAIALAGLAIGFLVSRAVYAKKAWYGLTRRNSLARGAYTFLWNKYYLDFIYEQIIVKWLIGPIAAAAVWFNQHMLDGIVNGIGKGSARAGRWTYKYLDQGLVDGAVNGSAAAAHGAGSGLRTAQTGKIQTYGVLFFGAAAVAVIALILSVQGK